MSDELDDLKAAFDAAIPDPDPARKAANLAQAEENFARAQGSRTEARQTHQRGPLEALLNGVLTMLTTMTSRSALTATTALVAVGLFVVLPQTSGMFEPGATVPPAPETAAEENVAQADALMLEEPMIVAEEPVVIESDAGASVMADRNTARPALQSLTRNSAASRQRALSSPMVEPAPRHALPETEDLGLMFEVPIDPFVRPESNTEDFANAPANPLKVTAEDPVSTFSIDVDTASYSVIRQSLMAGTLPPRDAVRIEEMVNYFPYDYAAPEGPHPFKPTIRVTPTPWNTGTQLVHIAIQGDMPEVSGRPPLNLVFLIDTSGSMQDANKLPLLKQSFRLMLSELRAQDQVSIVTYAGSAGQVLEPTAARDRAEILSALDRLEAGGSTAGQQGLQQAYQVAETMADEGEVTRVILATDGDFNVGLSDPGALKDFIAKKRDSGTYLSVLGFGRGNLDDATMQALAQHGNGQAAYIDTLSEARKVLVDQLTGALFPIANDVKIQVEFNPAQIAEYRLIGYETRALAREDFNNDRVDAGDIGAGHQVTALYEVTPVGSEAVRNTPLRYGETAELADPSDELGYFKLRYKRPGDAASQLIETPIQSGAAAADPEMRFAIAMAGFGELLRGRTALGDWGWAEAIALAQGAKGGDPYGYRAEAVTLMRLAESLSE